MSSKEYDDTAPKRMGDQFQQQRRSARMNTGSNATSTSSSSSSSSWGNNNNSSSNSHQLRGGGRRGGGRHDNTNRQQQQQQQQYASLPLEQGVISSLKESFGFIHCADRPDEIFFHYSQLKQQQQQQKSSAADLKMDMEVEFRVGTSGGSNDNNSATKKLAAYQVRPLPPGTIVWETVVQQHVRGLVENRVTPRQDGTIRVLEEKKEPTTSHVDSGVVVVEGQGKDDVNDMDATNEGVEDTSADTQQSKEPKKPTDTATGPLAKFGPNDCLPPQETGGSGRNTHFYSDGLRLAKGDLLEFTLVRDRRTKELWARNIQLLLSERNRARQEEEARLIAQGSLEHGVITALKGDYGFLRSNKRREEIYFHYSSIDLEDDDEEGGGNEDGNNGSGSELVLQEGQDMQFLVVTESGGDERPLRRVSARRIKVQPRGSVKFHDVVATGMTGLVSVVPQPQDSGHALDTKGKVLLSTSLKDVDDEGNEKIVTEVYLSSQDSPGGSFDFRGGSSVGLWIEVGDTLLFDVVKDYADGAFRAVPTLHESPSEDPTAMFLSAEDGNDNADKNKEPEIRLISLSLAHRSEGTVNAVKEAYGFLHFVERPVDAHFKLFQLLPDDMQKDLRRHMGLSDVDDNGNPLKLEVGSEVQFDMSVHGSIQSQSARHRGRQASHQHERENLKAQRVLLLPPGTIRQFFPLAKCVRGCVVKDNPKQPYSGAVELDEAVDMITPQERHPLVAKMINDFMARNHDLPLVYHDVQSLKEDDTVIKMIELIGKGRLSWTHLPQPGESHYPGRLCIRQVDSDTIEKLKEREAKSDEGGLDIVESELQADAQETLSDDGDEMDHRRTKQKAPKSVKTVRFDKSSLFATDDAPPGVGDIVEFDLTQYRRTGQCQVENMRVIERRQPGTGDSEGLSGVGIAKDVVPARKFGFISVIDDTANEPEMLFFSLSNVVPPTVDSGDGVSSKRKPQIRKGDEVKFDIGTEKSGKRVALNVTVLPKGTLPSKADKIACTGFILMEPSHTTMKKGSLRQAKSNLSQSSAVSQSSTPSSGRWDNVDLNRIRPQKEEPAVESGCILLLEAPSGIFDLNKTAGESGDSGPKESENLEEPVLRHLRYKNGALAIHGSGSSCVTDEKSKPRRGDKVSFTKTKKGGNEVRDVRLLQRGAASSVRGHLENISLNGSGGVAEFMAAKEGEVVYKVALTELVSCDPVVLKEKEPVEGILYNGKIYGICRTADLYLESKVAATRKERPKLNITVKKDRGGTIMAQSMMAKGPEEGSNGFAPGWTKRMSAYVTPFIPGSMGN